MEKRMLRNDINPWMLPDKEFKKRFRLDKECYRLLLDELTPHIEEGERNTRLSIDVRILAALGFFATGSYQKSIGDSYKIAISQQSMSKVLSEVLVAMEQIAPRWVRFPINDEEQRRIKHGFMETFNFPGVIGCIDCSHIAILQPLEDEHIYFNRKGFHSKNVQLICDSRMAILNVNANFGGSTHDSFIWRNSRIYEFMENLYRRGNQATWLLGDSGYPQQPWLLTPIANTLPGTPERAYVDAHSTTRNVVERCIGGQREILRGNQFGGPPVFVGTGGNGRENPLRNNRVPTGNFLGFRPSTSSDQSSQGILPQPNFAAFRANRTPSASSDQSYQRRNNARSANYQNNQRDNNDRNTYQRRYNHSADPNRTPRYSDNASSDRPRGRRPIMGFKVLERLLEKDSEELLLELTNSKKGIAEYVKNNLSEDGIVLFVKILKKVCDSAFDETKYKVLQTYLDDIFVNKLVKYTLFLSVQDKAEQRNNQYFWRDTDDYWNNLIKISQHILDSIPTFGRSILPQLIKSLIICFPSFETQHGRHISDGIKQDVNRLNEAVQVLIKEQEEKEREQANLRRKKVEDDGEPPDDFRQISLYPNIIELLTAKPGFLRKNVVEGPYRDVNHYLDVQFRLLREDFVGPLRSGIASYRSAEKQRIENVKIYKKVKFLNPETVNEQYCIRLRFDFSNKKKEFKYENSRRFMFGTLLCFTADNFKSIIFGKVANRDEKDLEKGELIVGFDQNTAVAYDVDYLMIECSVYFEPYFHVLNVLQNMSPENFPMEKYIIRVDRNVDPPEYLVVRDCRYKIKGHTFSPLLHWPDVNFYNLNESQLIAFKAALTQEFCIIQGPPGTGKTYLGLKIAKTLLENQHVWYKRTPMLVICFTNHALDQFLEGISEFTGNILRVGGQSKNEKLQKYNLKNKSRSTFSPSLSQQRIQVQMILNKIKTATENLKQVDLYDSVRSFDIFEDIVPNFKNSWFYRAKRNDILDWLLGEKGHERKEYVHADAAVADLQNQLNNIRIGDGEGTNESEESGDDDDAHEDGNENLQSQIDDLFEEIRAMDVQRSTPLITLVEMNSNIFMLQNNLRTLNQIENPSLEALLEEQNTSAELFQLQNKYEYLKYRLTEEKQRSLMRREPPRGINLANPHNMEVDDRWDLYFYWLRLYKQDLLEKLVLLNKQFRDEFKVYEEMRDIENTNTMKDVLVVGMTTTGAARLRSSLQALKSPIVIVEEAAEVLEAHIISSLTKHCKHLILIGDHQQLKPSTANYNVERFFNLGISLFERMVINKIQLFSLNVQHRMKPEISSLIAPTIYPNLEDHPSVNKRPPISGIDNCLFFIDHDHKEEACTGTSKKNCHEAEFLIFLARHLILNGYKPENITILAAYLGQMFEMQKLKKKHKHVLGDIRIAVLDNYQGEECDIILLSLVRNNDENKIGFLSIENRVCVALSRARNGFYLMGNMSKLCTASELWQKIRPTFEEQNALGNKLALRCQVHTDTVTEVSTRDDFLKISEGGCSQKCNADLVCGHKCTSLCHVLNRDHHDYKCRETCGKNLCDNDAKHVCQKMCYQECGPCTYLVQRNLSCGHKMDLECHIDPDTYVCHVPVSTKLPCGHVTDKPCYCSPETFRCPYPCETKVEPCGHACARTCHIRHDPDHLQYECRKKCARYRRGCTVETEAHLCRKYCYEECETCEIMVRKRRTVCPHVYDVRCHLDVDEISCKKPCTKQLPCGHKCKSACDDPCGKCEIKVDKKHPICGHHIKVKCCEEPDRKLCNKKCPLMLPCGHICTKKCNEPCNTADCKIKVNCSIKSPCGHVITEIECKVATSKSAQEDPKILLEYCNEPCRSQLKCGHLCSGSCGECRQGRIHKRCSEKCGFPLVCNHPCEFPCREACRPCAKPCPYKCKHSSCSKRCGDVCTPCRERCSRSCRHQKCTKFCGDICNVQPCDVPCEKVLECGHQCIGFCGDPCPPKCLVCDKEELTVIFFGMEEEEDARFVLLQDCGHIFESIGLDQWMSQGEGEISFKLCPQCKTPIKATQRYSDLIKQAMSDVAKVKINVHGSKEEIDEKRRALFQKLMVAKSKYVGTLCIHCPYIGQIFDIIEKRLQTDRKGKRQPINKPELNALECKLQVVEHVINICKSTTVNILDTSKTIYVAQVNFIMKTLTREKDYITNQEIDDIRYELNRLSRIVEFDKVKKSTNFNAHFSSNPRVKLIVNEIEKLLFSMGKFYDIHEQKVMDLLKDLSKSVASGIGITEQERREIVRVMGFKQGHWYKCPNGHPYAIADCGGAMVESKCNECGATIGGTHHRLRSDNAVATEMDGARHAAWSEAANMANYQL